MSNGQVFLDSRTAAEMLKSLRRTAVGKWVILDCDLLDEEAGWEIDGQWWYPDESSWRGFPLFASKEEAAEFTQGLSGVYFVAHGVKTEYGWTLDCWEHIPKIAALDAAP